MNSKIDQYDEWFSRSWESSSAFWERIGEIPDFKNKKILDLGCGMGAQVFQIAEHSPEKVIGIDIDPTNIDFALIKLHDKFKELTSIVTFISSDIKALPKEDKFDIIIAKDSFEHILDINETLHDIRERLVKGGRAYIGFGPLYHSPRGDHKWTYSIFPWGHLIIPEKIILSRISRKKGKQIESIQDIGLNKLCLREYLSAFNNSEMKIISLRTNRGNHPIYKISRIVSALPLISKYLTFNLYCVLEKTL